jgi:Ras-related protein Rab-1A
MNADYDYLMKVIVAGNSGTGKSSLIQQYVDKTFQETFVSTIGVDFKIKSILLSSGKVAKLQLWDTAGQERFRTIVSSYWRGADGVVFVFDLTDPQSFSGVKQWAEEVDRHAHERVQKILVGNKCDLVAQRAVTREMGEELARSLGLTYIETSARTVQNVPEVFESMAETIAKNYQSVHGIRSKPEVPLQDKWAVVADSGRCCL